MAKKTNCRSRLIVVALSLFSIVSCGGMKHYKPSSEIQSKSYVLIDGSKSRSSGVIFGSRKDSYVHLYRKTGDCQYKYLGAIHSKGGRSSKIFPLEAGEEYLMSFERSYTTTHSSPGMFSTSVSTSTKTNRHMFFINPKPEHTYAFQFDDKVRKMVDFHIYEKHGDKESKLDMDHLKKTECKGVNIQK